MALLASRDDANFSQAKLPDWVREVYEKAYKVPELNFELNFSEVDELPGGFDPSRKDEALIKILKAEVFRLSELFKGLETLSETGLEAAIVQVTGNSIFRLAYSLVSQGH